MEEKVSGGDTKVTYINKKTLLGGIGVGEVDYEIEDVGTVRLRGLTAKQGVDGLRGFESDPIMRFQKIILMGVINPIMTDADLALLADGKMGVVQGLAGKIMELSGISITKDDLNKQVDDFLEKTPSENSSTSSASKSLDDSPENSPKE